MEFGASLLPPGTQGLAEWLDSGLPFEVAFRKLRGCSYAVIRNACEGLRAVAEGTMQSKHSIHAREKSPDGKNSFRKQHSLNSMGVKRATARPKPRR